MEYFSASLLASKIGGLTGIDTNGQPIEAIIVSRTGYFNGKPSPIDRLDHLSQQNKNHLLGNFSITIHYHYSLPQHQTDYFIIMAELEVDYDQNVTDLYKYISESKWDSAIKAAKEFPEQARTWVVRYHEDSDAVMWRFLPIHSASAKQPPENVINSLISAYRKGAQCRDDQGMLPLHYASGNQASLEVIRLLLLANPEGTDVADPHGMLPLHFMAQWGPSSIQALDVLLFANRDAIKIKDNDGYNALELAVNGEYGGNDDVASTIRNFGDSEKKDKSAFSPKRGYVKDFTSMKEMVLLPNTSNAMKRLQEAASAQEKSRHEYTRSSKSTLDNRDDEHSILGALPSNKTFSSRPENPNPGFPTSVNRQMSSFDDSQVQSVQSDAEAKKMVNDLKAEVDRLRSAATTAETEAEKTISGERDKMQAALDEMKAHLLKCQKDAQQSGQQLDEKEQQGKRVESRLGDKENDLNNAMTRNQKLRKELDVIKKEMTSYKTKTSKLDNHLSTLSRTMGGMLSDQEQIMKASLKHEQHMDKVSLDRQQKMQELIDQEVNFARLSLEKQKTNELGSEEMINQALNKQKLLMANIQSVLNERRNN